MASAATACRSCCAQTALHAAAAASGPSAGARGNPGQARCGRRHGAELLQLFQFREQSLKHQAFHQARLPEQNWDSSSVLGTPARGCNMRRRSVRPTRAPIDSGFASRRGLAAPNCSARPWKGRPSKRRCPPSSPSLFLQWTAGAGVAIMVRLPPLHGMMRWTPGHRGTAF